MLYEWISLYLFQSMLLTEGLFKPMVRCSLDFHKTRRKAYKTKKVGQ